MIGELLIASRPELLFRWTGEALIRTGRADLGAYERETPMDPTPGYPHDAEVVRWELNKVAAVFPVAWPVTFYLPDRDALSRVNGETTVEQAWQAEQLPDGTHPRLAEVRLFGKRTPPHPAVTRYLVAHEYGHVVERWIAAARGLKPDSRGLLKEYARMRGLEQRDFHWPGPGHWHDDVGEVFACDFRLVVAKAEVEFWPHPGVDRPGLEVRDWWAEAVRCAAVGGQPE